MTTKEQMPSMPIPPLLSKNNYGGVYFVQDEG